MTNAKCGSGNHTPTEKPQKRPTKPIKNKVIQTTLNLPSLWRCKAYEGQKFFSYLLIFGYSVHGKLYLPSHSHGGDNRGGSIIYYFYYLVMCVVKHFPAAVCSHSLRQIVQAIQKTTDSDPTTDRPRRDSPSFFHGSICCDNYTLSQQTRTEPSRDQLPGGGFLSRFPAHARTHDVSYYTLHLVPTKER